MIQKDIIKLVTGVALIIAGLLSALLGLVVALFTDVRWLLLSLGGLLFIGAGVTLITLEVKRIGRAVRVLKRQFIEKRNLRR